MGCCNTCEKKEKEEKFDMSLDSSEGSTIPPQSSRPVVRPDVIGNEMRCSEVELSLYSEFSEDDYDNTNHTLNRESQIGCKSMFNQQIIDKLVKFCHPEVIRTYDKLGPFKIRSTDISTKMQNMQADLEYRKSVMQMNKNEYYCGQWAIGTDSRSGRGIYVNDKELYEGFWYNNIQHGKGRQIFSNGTYYIGDFCAGVKEGMGTLIWQDGAEYSGSFKNNSFEGSGTYKWANNNYYQGNFRRGKMNGQGIFHWTDGRIYEGEFQDGSRHGKGVYTWPDGRCYDGEWKDGKQHGIGTFIDKNGKKRRAECCNGEKVQWLD
ncbi:unnamed protein product [Moneuplotes crassus]|uniref:MORN repeat protein n=1 Tax=Euplotes crassus TaxID=5936 RepID=A0AAD2CWA7_EUPCR|nr:unnamed protein product [Moneuplotes crassus]